MKAGPETPPHPVRIPKARARKIRISLREIIRAYECLVRDLVDGLAERRRT